VVKKRRLFRWEGVRIHLDDVEGLGRFIELQASAGEPPDRPSCQARVEALRRALYIDDSDLISESYRDQLLANEMARNV
jgi:adenylate cyclase class 2